MLFNFVAEVLTRMILKAQSNRVVIGLVEHLIPQGIALLQYADDTIKDTEVARNVKLLLYLFE
jgi:hypothetical protein